MNTMNTQPARHLGTFLYRYEDGPSYRVTATADDTLHWVCVEGDEAGREATEQVTRLVVSDDVHLLSWVEADGLVVTQAVNYATASVHCVLVAGAERIVLQGSITRE